MSAKRALRRTLRLRRAQLARDLDHDAAGHAIAKAVLGFVPDPCRVAAYESLPDEPPTGPLIEALLATGHEVIVPITLEDFSLEWTYAVPGTVGDMATVTRAPADPAARTLGSDALATCDLIVTPGLGVDRHGTRMGQGGGCYDRALAHRNPAAPVVTLLHEGEFSETDLPREAHDQLVDGYVTTSGRVVRLRESPARGA
ncbi:MAG TPA: 5-formyltetrahydrofolate cyclo-ligase [Dermatophilaceae bacterium]|nr:5-formyltetrahydrofolate cyclo-ligase [Dermatophilaceae bacterium]